MCMEAHRCEAGGPWSCSPAVPSWSPQFSSVAQSRPTLCAPSTAAHQASLSITNSRSLLKLMSIELMMPSYHLSLWRPLLLLPSIFPSIRVFSNASALHIRWWKYWSFSCSISPFNEYLRLISFRIVWLGLLIVQRTLESSPAPQFKSPQAPWKGPLGKFPWKQLQVWLLPAHGITMKITEIQCCGKRAETLPVQQMGLVTQRRGELLDFGDDSRNSVLPPWLPLRGLSSKRVKLPFFIIFFILLWSTTHYIFSWKFSLAKMKNEEVESEFTTY